MVAKKSRVELILAVIIIVTLAQVTRHENSYNVSVYWPLSLTLKLLLPAVIAVYGVRKGSLDSLGGVLAFIVGLCHSLTSCAFTNAMVVFFTLGSRLSKWKLSTKKAFEPQEDNGMMVSLRTLLVSNRACYNPHRPRERLEASVL